MRRVRSFSLSCRNLGTIFVTQGARGWVSLRATCLRINNSASHDCCTADCVSLLLVKRSSSCWMFLTRLARADLIVCKIHFLRQFKTYTRACRSSQVTRSSGMRSEDSGWGRTQGFPTASVQRRQLRQNHLLRIPPPGARLRLASKECPN